MTDSYDDLDHLTTEEEVTRIQAYDYDAVGNRIEKLSPVVDVQLQANTSISLTYANIRKRLTELNDQPLLSDAVGNLTQGHTSRELEYDPQGRLDKVKISGNAVVGYLYLPKLGHAIQLVISCDHTKVQAVMQNDDFAKRWIDSSLVSRIESRAKQASEECGEQGLQHGGFLDLISLQWGSQIGLAFPVSNHSENCKSRSG